MPKVILLFRKSLNERKSIERVFEPFLALDYIDKRILPYDLNSILNIFKIALYLGRIRSNFIHITGDIHFAALFLFWKKIIITVHDCNHYEKLNGFKKKLFGLLWYRLPLKFAKRIVAISPFTKSQLIQYFNIPEEKILLIPNAVLYKPVRHKAIPSNISKTFKILVIGTKKNKNLERLIIATSELTDIQLDIVGRLPDNLSSQLKSSNTPFFNSWDISNEELSRKYLMSDVLFFASINEGFGLPIIEAQAHQLPVITSKISSMPFVAGKGAVFVDPYSSSEIRDAIVNLKVKPQLRNQLKEDGLANLKRFSLDMHMKKYNDLYKDTFNIDVG